MNVFTSWVGLALFAVAAPELGVYLLAPLRLAGLARLPLGKPRDLELSPEAVAALTSSVEPAGGYRDGAVPVLDLGRVSIDEEIEHADDVAVCLPRLARGVALVTQRGFQQALGYARIDFTPDGARVRARASFAPVPVALPMAVLVINGGEGLLRLAHAQTGPALRSFAAALLGSALIFAYQAWSARRRLEPYVAWAIAEIEARLQRARR